MSNHPWFNLRIAVVGVILLLLYTPAIYIAIDLGVPIWIVGVGTVLSIWFQYIIGCKRAIRNSNISEVPEDVDWINEETERIASNLGVKTPKVYIGHLGGPNAFAVGRKNKGTIVLSVSLLQILERDELEAVILHELSHLKSRDSIPMVIGQSVATFVKIIVLVVLSPFSGYNQRGEGKLSEWAGGVSRTAVMTVVYVISRQREYIADEDAKEVMGTGLPLSKALMKISQANKQIRNSSPPDEAESLCISSEMRTPLFGSTHPSIDSRIERLLKDSNYTLTVED